MKTEVSTTDKIFETQKIFEKLGTITKFFQKLLKKNCAHISLSFPNDFH